MYSCVLSLPRASEICVANHIVNILFIKAFAEPLTVRFGEAGKDLSYLQDL